MNKAVLLLAVLFPGLMQTGFSQAISNTDNVITLNNTCLNGGVSNGTYNLELNYFDLDAFASQTLTINGVSVVVSNGVMTITAPGGSFPSANTRGWSLPDAWPGHIKLTSGSFIGYMEFFGQPDGTVGINCIPLPVYFNSFSGMLSGASVVLNWQTGLESGSTAFEIYRSSTGSNYYKIGQVMATGVSNSNYSFTDANPDATNYYYLKELKSGLPAIFTTIVVVNCPSCHYTPPTPVLCSYTISGPDHICNLESPAVYTLSSSVPNFNTISWSIDQSAAVLRTYPAFDRGQVTLLKKNGAAGLTLTATLSGCTNPITKLIAVGTPTPVITATINFCPHLDATMSNAPGATSYEWWLTDENTDNITDYPGSGISKGFLLTSSDVYDVEGAYTNACGTSAQAYAYGYQCGGSFSAASGSLINVSPNPSRGMVNIGFAKNPASPASSKVAAAAGQRKIYQIRVMDAQGVVRKTFSYSGGVENVSVDLSSLNGGIYTIQVFDNKSWKSGQVLLTK
ncbi:MAG TPA: T9SS type A sorting domain-containing protein [Puia sp.]|nr:T9SS type A sorting domain-containing protein [Puia sp.]